MDFLKLPTMDLAGALGTMLAQQQQMIDELKKINTDRPGPQIETRTQWYYLSSANKTAIQIPVEGYVVGVLVGDSSSGRAVLNVDTVQIPIYTTAYVSQFLKFGPEVDFTFKNARVSFTPAGASDTWDVIIMVKAKA